MKQNIENAIEWIKEQEVKGCITGSSLLGIFNDSKQDVDVFLYNKASFTELFYAMYHNPMFTILDPLEKWKIDKFRSEINDYSKFGIQTIKFTYNTCIEVNIILKKNCTNIFSVISSFDLDIISKAIDIETKQVLDLTEGSTKTKIASWNKWNTSFYSPEIWKMSRILRQLERVFKYHNRGYNMDNIVVKYIELIDAIQKSVNIFNSNKYEEKLDNVKKNTKIIKQICEVWLETHSITKEEIQLLQTKIKEI
jgi:hypothetical protein